MKEFGVYSLKPTYLQEFIGVENQLAALKLSARPFVCVKLKEGDGQLKNWLIPLSSVNPDSPNYIDRLRKHNAFNALDKHHTVYAMDIFDDVLKNGKRGFKDVAWYYNALPVKGEYCIPYKDKTDKHIFVDKTVGAKMRQRLKDYLQERKRSPYVGFIKSLIEQGKENFKNYPLDQFGLRKALYRKELQLRAVRRQKLQEHEQFEQEQQRRRKLKRRYKGLTDDELVAATLDQCDEKLSQELAQQKTQRKKQSENQQIGQAQQAEQVKPLQNRQKGAQKQKSKPDGSGKK